MLKKEEYPKWIYSPRGESKIVRSYEEHREYPEWRESPADFPATQDAQAPIQPAASPVAAGMVQSADATMRRFYTVPAKTIADQVMALESLDEVREVRDMEELRPGGARKSVMAAVVARMEQLSTPPVAPASGAAAH